MTAERMRLSDPDWPEYLLHMQRYAFAARLAEGRTVLDCGCGEGYGTAFVGERAKSAIGIDNSSLAITACRRLYGENPRCSFEIADMADLSFADDTFDLVTCFEAIEHITAEKQQLALAQIRRVLVKHKGVLLVSTPDREISDKWGTSNPYHLNELRTADLMSMLQRYFRHVVAYSQQINMGSVLWRLSGDKAVRDEWVDQVEMCSGERIRLSTGNEDAHYVFIVCSDQSTKLPRSGAFFSFGREAAWSLWGSAARSESRIAELEQTAARLTQEAEAVTVSAQATERALAELQSRASREREEAAASLSAGQRAMAEAGEGHEARVAELLHEIEDLRRELAELQSRASREREEAAASLSAGQRAMTGAREAHEVRVTELLHEIEDLRRVLTRSHEDHAEREMHTARLEEQIEISERNNRRLAQHNLGLERCANEVHVAELVSEELRRELTEMRQVLTRTHEDYAKREMHIARLEEQIEISERNNRCLSQHNLELERARCANEARVAELVSEELTAVQSDAATAQAAKSAGALHLARVPRGTHNKVASAFKRFLPGARKIRNSIASGDRARDAKDWITAQRNYDDALRRNPTNAPIWVQYGHALKEVGNVLAAADAYRRALALSPAIADTHLQLGHALKLLDRRREATLAYLEAIHTDPAPAFAIFELTEMGLARDVIDSALRKRRGN